MGKTRRKSPPPGPAWAAAKEHGVDMSLLEANLRKTPDERIRAHQRALNIALTLRKAVRRQHAGT